MSVDFFSPLTIKFVQQKILGLAAVAVILEESMTLIVYKNLFSNYAMEYVLGLKPPNPERYQTEYMPFFRSCYKSFRAQYQNVRF